VEKKRGETMPDSKPDTKTNIFNTALRLFAAKGVENVSMRDIADAVGIKAASIYNHYTCKEQIVEACYDFFLKYHDAGRLSKEQYTLLLQNGTRDEIVNVPNDQFPEELAENLIYAMIILFSRIYTDAKAIDVYTKMVDHSMNFLDEFLNTGIKLGRFEEFNIRGVSMLFLSARLFVSQSVTISPEALQDWGIAQQEMISELTKIIPFKY
jgi:AcrR family transcriptional regulator